MCVLYNTLIAKPIAVQVCCVQRHTRRTVRLRSMTYAKILYRQIPAIMRDLALCFFVEMPKNKAQPQNLIPANYWLKVCGHDDLHSRWVQMFRWQMLIMLGG